ncbi:MAG: glycosyltransferase family 2 protein, partial [Desulfosudaceae bacterium]
MKASVIISAYNNLADLGLLLPSLARQSTGDHEMEVILRDDGSLDGTAAWIEKYYPWIQLIQGENVGFSRSNNIAAGRTSGEVLVFINADTVLDER